MKIIISENQLTNIIQTDISEIYPESWNIDEFKKLKSFNSRIKYCEEKLRRISSGSSRIVYQIDNDKVLKIAKNRKGLQQNEQEIQWGNNGYYGEILAKVFDYDENNLWVEMELARKITPKKFQEIIGVPLFVYEIYLTNKINKYQGKRTYNYDVEPNHQDLLDNNDFVNKLVSFIMDSNGLIGDYGKLTSFGIVNRDGEDTIVVIDYGLTIDDFENYYNRR